MKTTKIVSVGAAVALAGGVLATLTGAGAPTPTQQHAAPVNPARFDHPKPNPYFPLRPGTVSHYRGTDEGERLHEKVVVTHHKKRIQGVRTTVVFDVMHRADGSLAEKTHDWYAADNAGNVWYFGEKTATYDEHGNLESREGSWEAGVKGAVAGTIMPANPRPTDAFRQEFFRRHAEDQAWIVQNHAKTAVPYGNVKNVVRSFEWTRLEPRVMSLKFYGPGLGIVREKDVAGGSEIFELVSVTHR